MPCARFIRPTGISPLIKGYLRGEGQNTGVVIVDDSQNHASLGGNGGVTNSNTKQKFGKTSLKFTGYNTTCYVSFPAAANYTIGTSPFMISCWVNIPNTGHNQTIYCPGGSNKTDSFIFSINPSNCPNLYSNGVTRIIGSAITNDVWHFIALVGDSASIKVYVDGSQIGSTWTTNYNFGQYTNYIGYNFDAGALETFGGYIDDFVFYKGIALDGTKVTTRSLI